MNNINIYNSLSRTKQEFIPLKEGCVFMYVCGPTVYGHAHLGHARCAVTFDILHRYFRFLGYKVKLVRNYTDVGHLEFDADSDEYRKLKVGEKFDYYYGSEKKECVVTAINGKFVIAFSVYKTPVGNLKERTEQTEPEFADKGMQKAYNAFVSI